ncbi:MAG: energy-coupling factor transporter transmembrane protein EcfT [Firmicutes bacterium]|nr:energy-coupling factor transporter transmembrane protein EcfT [Bacillota bacterium]
MQIRQLFIEQDSYPHRLAPTTKLIGVLAVLSLAFLFPWHWTPIFLLVGLFLVAYQARVAKRFADIVFKSALPYLLMLFAMQSLFYPGGQTEIGQLGWFTIYAEGVHYATVVSLRILSMISGLVLVQLITDPAEMMTDLEQNGLSPKVSYVIIATLNILPFMLGRANAILDAQRSRGLETEGKITTRAKALLSLIGPLVVGTINDVQDRAVALELRGFSRKGSRTYLQSFGGTAKENLLRRVLWLLAALGVVGRVITWLF